jgi:hypothetical protein
VRTAILALVIAGLAVVALAATAASPAGHPSAVPNCLGKPLVQPVSVVLACADANFGLRKLGWIGWGGARAAATGIAYANDCTPNCAAGHVHTYSAEIVVDGSQRCGKTTAYRRLTVAFVGPSPYPKAKPADLTYPLRCV